MLPLRRRWLPRLPAVRLDRDRRRGMVDPNVFEFVGYDPEKVSGFAFGVGARTDGAAPARAARHPRSLGERPAAPGAVLRVPISWLREYVDVDASTEEIAARLAISTCEVERIIVQGVADEDGNLGLFRVGRVVEAGKHPNADRLQLCRVDVGEGEPRQIVCGAWNFGEGATVAVALPGAVLPDGQPLAEVKLRGESSSRDDPLRTRARSRRRPRGDHRARGRSRAGHAARGRPSARASRCSRSRRRRTGPTSLSIYGIAREVAAIFGGELRPMPGRDPDRMRRRARGHPHRGSRALPSLRRPALPRRQDRPGRRPGSRRG